MARLAVEAVVERLDGGLDRPPRDILLDPHLVVRRTTGPAGPCSMGERPVR
jgi:DNA-binding LacI/PurR family transcriptional regulator